MKKRKLVLALMLSLMMLVTMIPSFSFADETGGTGSSAGSGTTSAATSGNCGATGHESDVTWSFDESSGTLTISGSGAMADYTVNGSGDDRPWKDYAESITKVQISEGVTSLGKSAFQNLTALRETNIPASITQLGDHIYRGDASLTTVNWAKGFTAPTITDTDSNASKYSGTYVPTSMFDGCTSLGANQELSAWLPESFTGVGCAAFRGTAFKVDFEKWTNLSYIGAYGFAMMPNLDAVTVKSTWQLGLRGDNKTSCAFKGSGAKNVVIELRENIPLGLFQDCASLTSVTLPDEAKTIGLYAFAGTTALEGIDLKNVETISDYAFSGCGIKKLVFPEKLRKVGGRAFSKNEALTELIINSSDLEIQGAFMGCSALSYVETSEGTNVTFANSFGKGSQTGETACEGVRKLVANGTIRGSIAALTGLKELTVNGSSETGLTGTTVPDSVETLTITGDQWQTGGYVFAKLPKPKNLVVTAKTVTPQVDENKKIAEATFRSNLTLETAQFTGDDVTLNPLMFSGCSKLKQLDLSKVKKLAIGPGCFGNDTNTKFTGGSVNYFNTTCNIYVDSADEVSTVRNNTTGLTANSGIVLVVNGGTVKMGETGFDSVTKKNHYAEWYEDSECKEKKVTTPAAGKTYYAKWKAKADQEISFDMGDVTVHANEKTVTNPIARTENGGSVTYTSSNKDVATVDATTGKVTIVGAGTATITATAAETGDYKEASASYDLTVTQHEFSDQWLFDENNHWHKCIVNGCDAKSGSADHEFQWVVDKEATTTEKGSKHEECTVCGYKKVAVEIPVIESGTTGGDQNNGNAGNGTKADTANGSKTGDAMPIGMLAVLMLAAAAGIVFCGRKLYKSR